MANLLHSMGDGQRRVRHLLLQQCSSRHKSLSKSWLCSRGFLDVLDLRYMFTEMH